MISVRQIDMQQAEAGMLLAENLLDSGGGILLPQGAPLTDSNIASLRRRGIDTCRVLAPPSFEDDALLRQRRERALARLDRIFRHSDPHDASGQLLAILRRYREGA